MKNRNRGGPVRESGRVPGNDRERGEPNGLDASVVQLVLKEMKELIRSLEGTTTTQVRMKAGGLEIEVERQHGTLAPAGGVPGGITEAAPTEGLMPVLSPLVGTFYRAPSPGAKRFVEIGDTVEPGQQIAIVEAMKVMNEVTSAYRGVVVEVLVEDAQPVHYEQRLMVIDTRGGGQG